MGLTVYYDWKIKTDVASARRLITRFRKAALNLPFDEVSEIREQDPPDGTCVFEPYDHSFREGDLYLPRKRSDGVEETVHVPAMHALFFIVRVQGAESALIGLASHPAVVVHREDVVQWNQKGAERGRHLGQGDAIEFPTRRRGYYSWHSFCKTRGSRAQLNSCLAFPSAAVLPADLFAESMRSPRRALGNPAQQTRAS